MGEEALAFERRRGLYALVAAHPGLHLRELERLSGLALGTLRYHLEFLQEHRLVEATRDKYYVRYFAVAVAPAQRGVLAALRQDALRRVVVWLLARGGNAGFQELRAAFPIPASTFAAHLAELVRRGVLVREAVGRTSRYRVQDPEGVLRLLLTYRASFLDDLVDHLLATVDELPGPRAPEEDPDGGPT